MAVLTSTVTNTRFLVHSSASGSDKRGVNGVGGIGSDEGESDDGEEGDYTVYECPGLAPVSRRKLCFVYPSHTLYNRFQ